MKLLIITAIAAFENDIKAMLNKAQVKTFTYYGVTGYKDISNEIFESNWFASEVNKMDSILFNVFVENEKANTIFDLATDFNNQQKAKSQIHIAIVNIEKSN